MEETNKNLGCFRLGSKSPTNQKCKNKCIMISFKTPSHILNLNLKSINFPTNMSSFNFFRNPPKVSFRNGQNVEILLTLSWDAEKLRNAPISGKIRPKLEELLCQKCKHTKSLL